MAEPGRDTHALIIAAMPSNSLAVGDTVRLKSGGPAMTVQLVANDGSMAYCTWFEGETLKTGAFALATLRPVAVQELPPAKSGAD